MTTPIEQLLGEALEELVSTQPFQPDTSLIHRRGRILRRRTVVARAAAGVAVTAVAAVVAVTATGTTSPHGSNSHDATSPSVHSATVTSPAVHSVTVTSPGARPATVTGKNHALTELAAYITANATHQAGDATLVARTQSSPDRSSTQGFDLYTDSGEYFYAATESGLPAAIASNANVGDGMNAREIAAAEYAVNGSLAVADQRMAYAPFADGKSPTAAQRARAAQMIAQKLAASGIKDPHLVKMVKAGTSINVDNYVWEDSEEALQAGAGNPQVRAGVLRILSTLPGITVTTTEVAGQAALALTATGTPDLPADYHETITINASTGIPISLVGGTNGETPEVTVTLEVSRVTVSAIKAGRF
jgi:hypothetical protein